MTYELLKASNRKAIDKIDIGLNTNLADPFE